MSTAELLEKLHAELRDRYRDGFIGEVVKRGDLLRIANKYRRKSAYETARYKPVVKTSRTSLYVQYKKDYPDATLAEMAHYFGVSPKTISSLLVSHRKKNENL